VFAFREHYGTDDMCFLDTSSNANYMLTVPIGLCLFANSVVMIYILRNIGKHVEGSVAVAKAQVKGVIAFGATLGLVYIFGAMNIIWKGNKVFPVIFALGVGIQGALIFYFHVYEKDAFKKRIHDRISGKGGQKSKLNLRSSKSKRGSKSRSSTSRSSSSERGRGASNSVEGNSMVIMENVTEETEETEFSTNAHYYPGVGMADNTNYAHANVAGGIKARTSSMLNSSIPVVKRRPSFISGMGNSERAAKFSSHGHVDL